MLVFKDLVSGDELFSDANRIKDVDGLYFEVSAKLKTEKTGIDERLLGANPSAEEKAEGNEDSSVSGIDVVLANRLVSTGFTKKQFGPLIKSYFKKALAAVEEKGVEDYSGIKERAGIKCKEMYENHKEIEFWIGETMHEDGVVGFSWYTTDTDVTMLFFKFGIKEEKF